jgi:CheY-like chemotaxis protein
MATLRGMRSLRPAPVLLGGINTEKGHAYRIHASDHRLHPTDPDELRQAVRRLLPDDRPSLRLLVIEDQESAAEAMREAFASDERFQVRLAASSTEAYHATRGDVPDVVILSLMMARAEGFRALEILRKDQRLRGTPVLVLLSGEPHPEERRQIGLYTDYIYRQGTGTADEFLAELQAQARSLTRP